MVRRIGSGRERAWRRETGAGEVKIAVVGGGAWGTALADLLARKGGVESVTLWAREPEVVDSINREHINHVFLPGATLDPRCGPAETWRAWCGRPTWSSRPHRPTPCGR